MHFINPSLKGLRSRNSNCRNWQNMCQFSKQMYQIQLFILTHLSSRILLACKINRQHSAHAQHDRQCVSILYLMLRCCLLSLKMAQCLLCCAMCATKATRHNVDLFYTASLKNVCFCFYWLSSMHVGNFMVCFHFEII